MSCFFAMWSERSGGDFMGSPYFLTAVCQHGSPPQGWPIRGRKEEMGTLIGRNADGIWFEQSESHWEKVGWIKRNERR